MSLAPIDRVVVLGPDAVTVPDIGMVVVTSVGL